MPTFQQRQDPASYLDDVLYWAENIDKAMEERIRIISG
jgi:hypothetical protein